MEYGKNLINQWPMLQGTAGNAKMLGCSERCQDGTAGREK
jgi:hypothetical protein